MRSYSAVVLVTIFLFSVLVGVYSIPEVMAQTYVPACPFANPTADTCDSLDIDYNAACCYLYQSQASNVSGARDLYDIMRGIGGFLLVTAGIVAGIVIIVAGLLWMAAGSDTGRVTTAKAVFKNGIIGAVIIFAAGTIIMTVGALATDPLNFFG